MCASMCTCAHMYTCISIYLYVYVHIQYCYASFYRLPTYKIAFSVVAKFTNPAHILPDGCGLTRNPGDFRPDPHSLSPLFLDRLPSEGATSESALAQQMPIGLSRNPFPEEPLPHAKLCCCYVGYRIRVEGGERGRMSLAKSLGLLINKLWHCFSGPLWWTRRLDTLCLSATAFMVCCVNLGETAFKRLVWFRRRFPSATFKRYVVFQHKAEAPQSCTRD